MPRKTKNDSKNKEEGSSNRILSWLDSHIFADNPPDDEEKQAKCARDWQEKCKNHRQERQVATFMHELTSLFGGSSYIFSPAFNDRQLMFSVSVMCMSSLNVAGQLYLGCRSGGHSYDRCTNLGASLILTACGFISTIISSVRLGLSMAELDDDAWMIPLNTIQIIFSAIIWAILFLEFGYFKTSREDVTPTAEDGVFRDIELNSKRIDDKHSAVRISVVAVGKKEELNEEFRPFMG